MWWGVNNENVNILFVCSDIDHRYEGEVKEQDETRQDGLERKENVGKRDTDDEESKMEHSEEDEEQMKKQKKEDFSQQVSKSEELKEIKVEEAPINVGEELKSSSEERLDEETKTEKQKQKGKRNMWPAVCTIYGGNQCVSVAVVYKNDHFYWFLRFDISQNHSGVVSSISASCIRYTIPVVVSRGQWEALHAARTMELIFLVSLILF